MDEGSLDPLSQSVAGSSTNPMEGVEGEGQSAPINVDDDEHPTHQNKNPSGDASLRGETGSQGVEEETGAKRKRQKTSKMWEGFTLVTLADGTQKAQCIYCKSKLTYDGTTSSCLRHLDRCEPRKDHQRKQQLLNFPPSTSDVNSGQKKLHSLIRPDKYDSNKMREAMATWVMGMPSCYVYSFSVGSEIQDEISRV